METINKEDLIILSIYTQHSFVPFREIRPYMENILGRKLKADDLLNRESQAKLRGNVQDRAKAVMKKLYRMAQNV